MIETARTKALGEIDGQPFGNTRCRHVDPATDREYTHAAIACEAPYERPADGSGFGAGLSDARLDELTRVHDARADEAAADADQAEAKAIEAQFAGDLDEAVRQRSHARAARRLAWEYRQYANGYRQRRGVAVNGVCRGNT